MILPRNRSRGHIQWPNNERPFGACGFAGVLLRRWLDLPWLALGPAAAGAQDAPDNRGNAARLAALGARGARRRGRQPGRQAPLRRSAVQLQQARQAGRQHLRRAARLHQAQAVPAHRRREYQHTCLFLDCFSCEVSSLRAGTLLLVCVIK